MNIEAMKKALEVLETLNYGDTYKTHNAATALRQAIEQEKAEREECAKVLDEMANDMAREMEPSTAIAYVRSKAAAIRARSNT